MAIPEDEEEVKQTNLAYSRTRRLTMRNLSEFVEKKYEKDLEALRSQNEELEQKVEELTAQAETYRSENESLKRDLDKIKSDVSLNYDEKLKRAEARIAEMET